MCSDNYPSPFPSGPHVSIISFHPPHTADRQIFSRLTLRFLVANSDSSSPSDELVIIIVINVILFKTHLEAVQPCSISFRSEINFLALSSAHDWSILLSICVRYISSYCGANIVMKHKCEAALSRVIQSEQNYSTFYVVIFQSYLTRAGVVEDSGLYEQWTSWPRRVGRLLCSGRGQHAPPSGRGTSSHGHSPPHLRLPPLTQPAGGDRGESDRSPGAGATHTRQ